MEKEIRHQVVYENEQYKITCMYGIKKFIPPKYVLERQPDGSGKLTSDFGYMTGDWDCMVASAYVFGPDITIIEHEEYKPKPIMKRWKKWLGL